MGDPPPEAEPGQTGTGPACPEQEPPRHLSAVAARAQSGKDGCVLTPEEIEAAEAEAEAWARRVNSC